MRSVTVTGRWRSIGLAAALLAVASCGGGGGGGSSTPPLPGSKLFISDGGNHAIASMINPTPTVGSNPSIDRVVEGPSTGLGAVGGTPTISSIPSIALDAANDRLFAATQLNAVVFDNIGTADGNVPFSRRISASVDTGGGSHSVNFYGLYLDTTNNILYTVDPAGEVHVFNNASTRNGATTPDRTVTPNLGTTIVVTAFGIAVDKTRNMLYVGIAPQNALAFMIVFNGASTVNTNTMPNNSLVPDRTIALGGAGAFYLDEAGDRLYVAQFNGPFLVFNNAHALTGTPTPDRTITVMGNTTQNFIFVDTSRDKLYAVSNALSGIGSALLIVDNASTTSDALMNVNGIAVAITGANIRLSAVAVKP